VENVKEELEQPGEWWYDEAAQELYVWPNSTSPDGSDGGAPTETLVVPTLQTLIRIKGTQASPVKNVTIRGVNFRDASYTFMERFGVPSGGDWSLYRGGAVFLDGTEGTTLADGLYRRLDGNAVFVSGYNRDATIKDNEFLYVADNAIAGWGRTDAWDGRGGDYPRNTLIEGNLAHELAFFEKQSSFWFQVHKEIPAPAVYIRIRAPAVDVSIRAPPGQDGGDYRPQQHRLQYSARSDQLFVLLHFRTVVLLLLAPVLLVDTYLYSLSAVNDGFGGGNDIDSNLIWNTCRESGDHGPINSWDRQVRHCCRCCLCFLCCFLCCAAAAARADVSCLSAAAVPHGRVGQGHLRDGADAGAQELHHRELWRQPGLRH